MSEVSMCPPKIQVDTIILNRDLLKKMTSRTFTKNVALLNFAPLHSRRNLDAIGAPTPRSAVRQ
jgi:hypothetical protein